MFVSLRHPEPLSFQSNDRAISKALYFHLAKIKYAGWPHRVDFQRARKHSVADIFQDAASVLSSVCAAFATRHGKWAHRTSCAESPITPSTTAFWQSLRRDSPAANATHRLALSPLERNPIKLHPQSNTRLPRPDNLPATPLPATPPHLASPSRRFSPRRFSAQLADQEQFT